MDLIKILIEFDEIEQVVRHRRTCFKVSTIHVSKGNFDFDEKTIFEVQLEFKFEFLDFLVQLRRTMIND